MKIIETSLPGVMIVEPKVFGDARGFFLETWQQQRYEEAGITSTFVQDNLSFSQGGVLRGLHFQHPNAQGKLVQVLQGEVFDVAVDIRRGSPTFGQWMGARLSADNKRLFYIPPDFAHGFCVMSDTALFSYKCTNYYHPETEHTLAWNDPEIAIDWPISDPILSDKDRNGIRLTQFPEIQLPVYSPPAVEHE